MMFRKACLCAGMVLAAACPAVAQQTVGDASVRGRVTDPSGAVLPGAEVSVRHVPTAVTQQAVTDEDGRFHFAYLRIGPSELEVRFPGFATSRRLLTLDAGSAFDIPVVLELESLTSDVTVTTAAPLRSEEHTSELQSRENLVCRLLREKKK